MQPVNKKQLFIGLSGLLIGLMIYFIDRPGDTYLVNKISGGASLYNSIPGLFGPIGYVLPAFIHVFSFSLITSGLLGCSKKGAIAVCSGWLAVNFVFELGQKFKAQAVSLVPENYVKSEFLEIFCNYFKFGTFDNYDLIAIVLGAAAAYSIIAITIQGRRNNEYQ